MRLWMLNFVALALCALVIVVANCYADARLKCDGQDRIGLQTCAEFSQQTERGQT